MLWRPSRSAAPRSSSFAVPSTQQEFGFVAQDQSSTELHGLYALQKQQDDAVHELLSTKKLLAASVNAHHAADIARFYSGDST